MSVTRPSPMPTPTHWHILTGEYPPAPGGISDYTYQVASGLAGAGDRVSVWTTSALGETPEIDGVCVNRRLSSWSPRSLSALSRSLDETPAPRRLLVQYAPSVWGYRSLNIGFAHWLLGRRRRGDDVWTMVHEPYYGFLWKDKPTRWLIAGVTAHSIGVVLRASNRVFYSIPAWEPFLRWYDTRPDRPMTWLPVPTTVPPIGDAVSVARRRAEIAPAGQMILGHFGTYGPHTWMLREILVRLLLGHPDRIALLLGRNGGAFAEGLELAGQVVATDGLPPERVSPYLSACDLMIQPYDDGISTRRTTVMAALAHGVPVVSGAGSVVSEPLWSETGAVLLAASNNSASMAEAVESLLSDSSARARVGRAGLDLYTSRFAVEHTVSVLRSAAGERPARARPVRSEVKA